jgi:hypothetical protein
MVLQMEVDEVNEFRVEVNEKGMVEQKVSE